MKILVTDGHGVEHEVEATDGWTIMEIIRDAGLPIKAECGGSCVCATCHVLVDDQWFGKLPEKNEEEIDMLDLALEVFDNSRLSCQIEFDKSMDGMKVTIASDALM
jgi:ferredoxin, 2Fe-2S